ncbi:hypothetical protein F8388_013508 [Cannabis sativa]|uniref:Uncharacterized protein n=1 Tax=Cannabis sativa TaxID=3483 RepID=A0A7J6GAS1_CANSA|nr:hypothetical protein F8388_013508 [Cannabis sativa]
MKEVIEEEKKKKVKDSTSQSLNEPAMSSSSDVFTPHESHDVSPHTRSWRQNINWDVRLGSKHSISNGNNSCILATQSSNSYCIAISNISLSILARDIPSVLSPGIWVTPTGVTLEPSAFDVFPSFCSPLKKKSWTPTIFGSLHTNPFTRTANVYNTR